MDGLAKFITHGAPLARVARASSATRMEFIQEAKEFILEPPVVFYRSFIPCAILSTESSKQRLTFLLDRQFFASLSFDLVFMFCLKNLYDFAFA